MPKPTIVDLSTLFNANIIQPLCDLTWDVFGSDSEDRPVNTVDEAREKLKAVAQAGDTMTGPLTLPASDPTLDNQATRKSYVDDNVQAAKQYADDQIEAALDAVYPIGSIFISVAARDANEFLPGTWEKIAEGTFLAAAGAGEYALGATGGAKDVTLSLGHMPNHDHDYVRATVGYAGAGSGTFAADGTTYNEVLTAHTTTPVNSHPGTTQAHENRPPFLAVNMWYRTA